MVWSIGTLKFESYGVFSPGVLVVFQFYLVSMMTEVMEIYLGKNVGLDFDHFFLINLMEWNGVSLVFVDLCVCSLVPFLRKNQK